MNCPSRNDDIDKHPTWNQAPQALTADLTTRADLNGIANIRERDDRKGSIHLDDKNQGPIALKSVDVKENPEAKSPGKGGASSPSPKNGSIQKTLWQRVRQGGSRAQKMAAKYTQFIGPGFLIAVAYIDPGNYATDVNGKTFLGEVT